MEDMYLKNKAKELENCVQSKKKKGRLQTEKDVQACEIAIMELTEKCTEASGFYAKVKKFIVMQAILLPIMACIVHIAKIAEDYFFVYLWVFCVIISLLFANGCNWKNKARSLAIRCYEFQKENKELQEKNHIKTNEIVDLKCRIQQMEMENTMYLKNKAKELENCVQCHRKKDRLQTENDVQACGIAIIELTEKYAELYANECNWKNKTKSLAIRSYEFQKENENLQEENRIKANKIKALECIIQQCKTSILNDECLSLSSFKIPEDVLLLLTVATEDQDEFLQRVSVHLLSELTLQMDNSQVLLLGDAGAIAAMAQLIRQRLSLKTCYEVTEIAWRIIWTATDEVPINCRRFLDQDGMALFLDCLEAFPDREELLINMMEVVNNVADVKELRPLLMENRYITVFSKLLSSKCGVDEVSFLASVILLNIASDGPDVWNKYMASVSRNDVLDAVVKTIKSWKLETKLNIGCRSLKAILRLLDVTEAPEAQLWALWTLANLTKIYPEQYCTLLKEEGGLEMLQKIDHEAQANSEEWTCSRGLALTTLKQCNDYYKSKDDNVEAMVSQDEDGLVLFDPI